MLGARGTLTLLIAVCLSAAACSQVPEVESIRTVFGDSDRARIESTRRAALDIVNGSQDWDEYTSLYYDADAISLPPGLRAVKGRAEIRRLFDATSQDCSASIITDAMRGAGDLAYVVGRYHLTANGDGSTLEDGKFIEVWHRQVDGSWKVLYDAWNSNVSDS